MAPTGNSQSINDGVYRARPMGLYERQLKVWGRCALIIAILYALSQFLAYCNLTLATVALLGGFVSKLHSRDYAYVLSLILVEGARVTAASVFMRLLIAPSEDTTTHIPRSSGGQNAPSSRAHLYSNVVQVILIIPSFLLPCLGQKYLNYGFSADIRNLQMSLQIFYKLVAFNAMVALLYLLCSLCSFVVLSWTSERSFLSYHEKSLESAMNSTLVHADNFDFFQFAYTLLGREFSRNVEPEAVAKNYTMMIQYMYAHRVGVDFLEIYLDADNEFEQLAAANMVGFWADKKWIVGLPKGVLTKLADMVSTTTGQVGWAAITSFGTLGASSPRGAHIVATTRTSSGMRLPDRLAELINTSNASSLSLVRTLVGFYEQLCVGVENSPKPFGEEAEATLLAKLELLARGAEEQCIRVQAVYLLLLMGEPGWKLEEAVLGIEPGKDIYWFESEKMMLELLRRHMKGRADLLPLQFPFLRQDAPITPPAWALP